MVEGGEGLELVVGEKPELKNGARKVRVYGAGGELDKRRERQGHLMKFLSELGVVASEEVEPTDDSGRVVRRRQLGVLRLLLSVG